MRTAMFTIILLLIVIVKTLNPDLPELKQTVISIMTWLALFMLVQDWAKKRKRIRRK